MIDLGIVKPGSTLRIPWNSFNSVGGSVTMTNYTVTDILVYKDGSTTERASTSGFSATTDFDSKTGKHLTIIDLADNGTGGFFVAGSEYQVGVDQVTIDSQTVGLWVARFVIGYPGALLNTSISSLSSQTSFVLLNGSADTNSYVGWPALVHDNASAVQIAFGYISAYAGATKTVTLAADPGIFTMAAGDNISLFPPANLKAIDSVALSTHASGMIPADVRNITGSAVTTASAQIGVNVVNFGGSAGAFTAGLPSVNLTHITGSPVTTATAQLGVNIVNFGGSAGTFASGRPEVNMTHISGSTVSTNVAQLGVNIVNYGGSAGTFTGGRPEVNASHIAGSAVSTAVAQVGVNVVNWKGSTAPAMTGDAFARLGTPAGASTAADIAAVKTVADAVQAKTDNLPSDPADESLIIAATDALATKIDTAQADLDVLTGVDGATLATSQPNYAPAKAGDAMTLTGAYDAAKTAAPESGGNVAAIKAKTDSLSFTVAGNVDANIQYVNDVEVTGDGQTGTEWGPA